MSTIVVVITPHPVEYSPFKAMPSDFGDANTYVFAIVIDLQTRNLHYLPRLETIKSSVLKECIPAIFEIEILKNQEI